MRRSNMYANVAQAFLQGKKQTILRVVDESVSAAASAFQLGACSSQGPAGLGHVFDV